MSDLQEYHFEIQIRKKGGVMPKDSNGTPIPSIKLEKTFNPLFLDSVMKRTFKDFEAITPIGADINIEAYISNSISGTWMNMASYYGSEKRFVKLT